jgi:twitching motility protein PilT
VALREWIQAARKRGASDLHLEAGTAVVARVRGDLQPIGEPVAGPDLRHMGQELLGEDGWQQFLVRGSADLSLVLGGTRCRINLYQTVRGLAMAIRLLSASVSDLRNCNLHPDFRTLVQAHSGLVVISGPTGCGKSTTLAALIEELNLARACNIITLESPLEYVFTNRRSFIRQREIPTHSPGFEQAIIDSLRENPDVLVVSEMRSPEVMRLTLNAAETGHLVLATMHSSNCAEAMNRICMSFAPEIQGSVRAQLADCLVGVLCQRLDYLEAQQLRVPHCELMLASSAVRGTIRAGQLTQLSNVIQSGGEDGMWSFERYQRWMSQQKEWIRPLSVSPVADDPAVSARPAPVRSPTPTASAAPKAAAARRAPAQGSESAGEIVIDENMDLNEIAELAKRIERRTP